MRVLFWNGDKKETKKRPLFAGKRFNLLKVRWNKKTRKWDEVNDSGTWRWGIRHPVDNRIIGLKKDAARYGRVMELPDISVQAALGTPALGIIDEEE